MNNELFNGETAEWECPLCGNYTTKSDEWFGIHVIDKHDEELVEYGRYGVDSISKMKRISDQFGDDYFGQNPNWADDLEDLGEDFDNE